MANYGAYRKFLEEFAASVDPTDQLPVRVAGYTLTESELAGEIMDWTYQYLSDKKCPPTLVTPIVQIIVEETKQTYRKTPEVCGYNADINSYQPLKLMQTVIAKINDVCQRLLDNAQLDTIPPPPPAHKAPPRYAVSAIKNTRRKMEDRHVCIDDFNGVFGIENAGRASYYAVFDGHAGVDAATYAVSHLHCHLAASDNYPSKPAEAMRDAFHITDTDFLRKCEKQKLVSGTTALSVLYQPEMGRLYVGWLGDSKALLVTQGTIMQLVQPHKPELPAEKERINRLGGAVMLYGGLYRVNGSLAVSRAIGDPSHRPFVSGEPDIVSVPLSGNEDFLILGCDGLWDHVTEDDVAFSVYKKVREDPDNIDLVTKRLVELSIIQGSSDNISVIVVFLKDPHQISVDAWPSAKIPSPLDNMETAYDNSTSNGASAFNNSNEDLFQKSNLLHDFGLDMNCKGTAAATGATATPDSLNNLDVDADVAVDVNADDLKAKSNDAMDFIFGNPSAALAATNGKNGTNSDLLDSDGNAVSPSESPSNNGDGHDLGPETDVDAVDEPTAHARNPLQAEHELFFSEFNTNAPAKNNGDAAGYGDSEPELSPQHNPFVTENIEADQLLVDNKFTGDEDVDQQQQFIIEDNKHFEANVDDGAEPVEATAAKHRFASADFSEKKEFSFEREEYEKEIDSMVDLQSAMHELTGTAATSDDQLTSLASSSSEAIVSPASPPLDSSAEDNEGRIVDHAEEGEAGAPSVAALTVEDLAALTASDEDDEEHGSSFVVPVAEHEPSVDLTAAENVVVPESGEDSEDEWNYINVKQDEPSAAAAATEEQATEAEPVLSEQHDDDHNDVHIDENEQLSEVHSESVETTNTLNDEAEEDQHNVVPESVAFEQVAESHAIVQALVEPQEDFAELSENTGETQIADDHQNEPLAALSPQPIDQTPITHDDLNDDDDMDFQLNPDAKEFVPTSPQRTPNSSPYHHGNNGGSAANPLVRTNMLMDDDCVIAQSPRKGGVPMENILVPTENDFDDEIAHRPMELESAIETALLSPTAAAATNGNGLAGADQRPGSSGSTYSYQEMNLKEAMHGDEKLLEYAPEDALLTPDVAPAAIQQQQQGDDDLSVASEATNGDESTGDATAAATAEHATERFLRESDPMSMSFYNDGAAAGHNPFAVDMNAVQMLPQDDDEEEEEQVVAVDQQQQLQPEEEHVDTVITSEELLLDAPKPSYHFDGDEGQHFVIQDTEFGMNGTAATVANDDDTVAAFALPDEISKPEEDQYSPVTDPHLVEEFAAFSASKLSASHDSADEEPEDDIGSEPHQNGAADDAVESDRPEADLLQPTAAASSIVQVVQEMASEVTSVLANVRLSEDDDLAGHVDADRQSPLSEADDSNAALAGESSERSDEVLSEHVTASPVDDVPASIGELAESEQNYSQVAAEESERAAIVEPIVEVATPVEPAAPSLIEDLMQQTLLPVVGDAIAIEAPFAESSVAEVVQKTDAEATEVVEAAAVRLLATGTALGVVGAAAAVASSGAKKPAVKSTTAAGPAKKATDPKAKPTSTVAAAKKPTTVSSTARTASATAKPAVGGVTARSTTTTAAAAARPKTLASSSARTTSATGPAAASRPLASSTAAKKPLTNGVASAARSTSTLATKKPATAAVPATKSASATNARATTASAAAKPSVTARTTSVAASRTTTSKTSSASTTTTTTSKSATTTRAPISARTSTTTTSSATSTLKPRVAAPSRVSPVKPAVDKLAKDATNKLSSTTRTATAASPRTTAGSTAAAPKKTADISKSPSARLTTAPKSAAASPAIKRTTTASASASPASATTGAKKPTLSNRVSLAPSTTTSRRLTATATATTTTTATSSSSSAIKKRISAPAKPSATTPAKAAAATAAAPVNGSAAANDSHADIIIIDELAKHVQSLELDGGAEKFDVSKLNNGDTDQHQFNDTDHANNHANSADTHTISEQPQNSIIDLTTD